MVYFDNSRNSNVEGPQLASVQSFRNKLHEETPLLYHTVTSLQSWRSVLRSHLDRVLERILNDYQQSLQSYGDELMCIVSASQRIVRAEEFSERLGDLRLAFRLPGRDVAKEPILADFGRRTGTVSRYYRSRKFSTRQLDCYRFWSARPNSKISGYKYSFRVRYWHTDNGRVNRENGPYNVLR